MRRFKRPEAVTPSLRHRRGCVACLFALAAVGSWGWLTAAPASAVLPVAGAQFLVHDHRVGNAGWHVELQVSTDGRRLRSLTIYDQVCDETIYEQRVPLTADGSVRAGGSQSSRTGRRVRVTRWTLDATFPTAHSVEGTFRVVHGKCDTGSRAFAARHGMGHAHGPVGYADVSRATADARKEARRTLARVRRFAARRFKTYELAGDAGFHPWHTIRMIPGVTHVYHSGYTRDRRILDAARPESLVYWTPLSGERVLLGFMFRAPASRRPAFAGSIPVWHRHLRNGKLGRDQMTHVWLTRDIRSAYANCMPVPELEAANPDFRWTTPARERAEPDSSPCPQPASTASRALQPLREA